MLKLLNDYWALNWSLERLETLAIKLGADVPACLYDKPILVRGIGEKISHDIAYDGPRHILLVNPMVSVSTPAVFKHFGADGAFDEALSTSLLSKPSNELLCATSNSLQDSANDICPDVRQVLAALNRCNDVNLVRMAGSGATCFALFNDAGACERAYHDIQKGHPDWWCRKDVIRN